MKKNDVIKLIKFGLESEENKKKVIKTANFIIKMLNTSEKITENDLKEIIGGNSEERFE